MLLRELVEMIAEAVKPCEKPAVYVSGGLDSAIIVHHLTERTNEKIYTYSAKFNLDSDEVLSTKMLAEHYGTQHKIVDCSHMIEKLPEILKGFNHPRYNVWAYFLALQAKEDGRKTVYVGEGADQHFGGYLERDYLHGWADHYSYVSPMYKRLHEKLGLHLEMPFEKLDWKQTLKYYHPPDKLFLREVYRGILPDFVIEKAKAPPAFSNYWQLWFTIKHKFPECNPKSVEDIRKILRFSACKAWLEANSF